MEHRTISIQGRAGSYVTLNDTTTNTKMSRIIVTPNGTGSFSGNWPGSNEHVRCSHPGCDEACRLIYCRSLKCAAPFELHAIQLSTTLSADAGAVIPRLTTTAYDLWQTRQWSGRGYPQAFSAPLLFESVAGHCLISSFRPPPVRHADVLYNGRPR